MLRNSFYTKKNPSLGMSKIMQESPSIYKPFNRNVWVFCVYFHQECRIPEHSQLTFSESIQRFLILRSENTTWLCTLPAITGLTASHFSYRILIRHFRFSVAIKRILVSVPFQTIFTKISYENVY